METKVCNKCGVEKQLSDFNKEAKRKDGFNLCCRSCNIEYMREYRKNHKANKSESQKKYYNKSKEKISLYQKGYRENNNEKIVENNKKYYIENKDKINERNNKYNEEHSEERLEHGKKYRNENKEKEIERHKKYREEYPDKSKGSSKKYREENPDKARESSKNYRKNNRGRCNIITQTYRARKKLLPHTFTIEEWEATKKYFNQECCYCGRKLPLQMEHFISVNKGGSYTKENIIPSCGRCNFSKQDADFDIWYKKQKQYSKEREIKIIEYIQLTSAI